LGEHCFTTAEVAQLNSALQAARTHHVTVINSSGDFGAAANPCREAGAYVPVKGVNLLNADPLVLAAGGTSPQANRSTGAYAGETVWNALVPPGYTVSSGGGFSQLFPRPAYQDGVPGIGATCGVPDVAADAANDTGMAMAISNGGQHYSLIGTNGTSAAAPLWAAMIAPRRPIRPPGPGLRQPRHLPHRPQPLLPQGVPRHHHWNQHRDRPPAGHHHHRLPGRDRLGPGHRLGKPQRPTARPSARPLRQPRSQPGVAYNGWRDHQLTANPFSTRRVAGTPSIGSRTRSCACEAACSSIMRN
jgi:hypothetical protein